MCTVHMCVERVADRHFVLRLSETCQVISHFGDRAVLICKVICKVTCNKGARK